MYQIITDTDSDLAKEYVVEKGLIQVPQYTLIGDVTYEGAEGVDPADFYNQMRNGVEPKSQAINPSVCEEKFRAVLEQGKDILYLSFAATLSGSINTAEMVGKELMEEFPGRVVKVVDTCSASLGEAIIVMKAVDMQEEGKSMDEIVKWIEDNRKHMCHLLVVDDIKHLQRGGRVSKGTAFVGSVLGIRPVIVLNNEDKLVSAGTVRGKKKVVRFIVDTMKSKITDEWKAVNTRIGIAHGNADEEANELAAAIREEFGDAEIVITNINPSIGVHSGPGALLINFFGTSRE